MTIASSGPTYVQVPGNGASTVFAFPFKIFQATDLVVGFIAGGVYTEASGYTVQSIDNNGGGSIMFTTAPPTGTTVDIRTQTPQTQSTEFANLGAFLPETHTEAFDRITRVVQDLTRQTYIFGVHGPDQEDTPWPALPAATARANTFAAFDSNGLPTVASVPVSASGYGFALGNQTPVAGSVMQIDRLLENTPSGFTLQSEGAIWPSTAYAYAGVSREVTATTVPGQGNSGPLVSLFAFINNNGATANAVALIADAVGRTANSNVFGANIIARNANVNGVIMRGVEIDVQPTAGTTIGPGSGGLYLNFFNIAGSLPAIQLGGVAGGTWGNGVVSSHITGSHYSVLSGDPTEAQSFINTANGAFSQTAIVLGVGAGNGIALGGNAVFGTNPFLYADNSNNINVQMGATDAILIRDHTGAQAHSFSLHGLAIGQNNSVPAGGSDLLGLLMTSTANLGVFVGSGAPTLSAAQGSLYLRTDGSSTSTRLYVNTNGSTGWTNFVSAS